MKKILVAVGLLLIGTPALHAQGEAVSQGFRISDTELAAAQKAMAEKAAKVKPLSEDSASALNKIELRGVLLEGDTMRLSLLDRSTDTSRWVEVGQTFSGYKVTGYNATTETATLSKDGATYSVRLAGMKIKPADPLAMIPTRTREEIQRAVLNNLRQIAGAADQYYLEHGGNTVTLAELVGPTKYIKQLNPVDGESYAGMQLKSGAPISVTTAQGITVSFAP